MKRALITGITGQDGAYLAEFLLKKGYEVHGIKRRTSLFNTNRIDHLYQDPHQAKRRLVLHYGDMTDSTSLIHMVQKVQPDEIYNLAAQSHVQVSFEEPEYTANSDALGTLRMLEAIRILSLTGKSRFYQASTSEMYGLVQQIPQSEKTPFYPRSPYGCGQALCLLDHGQLPRVLRSLCLQRHHVQSRIAHAWRDLCYPQSNPRHGAHQARPAAKLYLGNLDSKRDWGHARDYVEMQWLMLQQQRATDYVIATGVQYSVREFVTVAAACLDIHLEWKGTGIEEQAYDQHGNAIVAVDPRYFRPAEVETLLGDASKARKELGWSPRTDFHSLVEEMAAEDLKAAERDALVTQHGYAAYNFHES